MAEESKQTQNGSLNAVKEQEVKPEPADLNKETAAPVWLSREGESKKESAKQTDTVSEKDAVPEEGVARDKDAVSNEKELPAWVKKAGYKEKPPKKEKKSLEEEEEIAGQRESTNEDEDKKPKKKIQEETKKDDKTNFEKEVPALPDKPTQEQKDAAKKKKTIFDDFKEMFTVSDKKRAEITKDAPEAVGVEKKQEALSPEEKKRILEAEKLYQEGLSTIRDLIAPSSMNIEYDQIRIEGMYAQSYYVFAYPRYMDSNWLSPVINYDVTIDLVQYIYPIDSASIMRVLKRKVAQLQSSIRISEEKGNVRDPAIETALEDAEELRTEIQRGQEKFFQFGLYFTIYAEDKKKIGRVAKQIQSLLGGKLVLTKRADFQAEHGFTTTLPLCLDELEINLNMNTSPLSTMFPFSSADLTSNKGILYGLNRHNDSLIIFDRFSLENANSVVFAKSGAGKSYGVKLEVLRSLMLGIDVIIIDPENEYEALTETVGGAYLRVSLNSDRRINPFDLPAPLKNEVVQPGDLLRSNIISMHGLLKIMLGGTTPEEEGVLDKALTDVYALRGITMDTEDPSGFPPPTMEDLYDILNSMEGAGNLAMRLAKFTQGTYAGIFNKPTNVDLTSGLVVFSIRDLEDALRPIAMYIILNFIWNSVRSSLKKRILVIDEAWSLMQHDDSAKFLYGLVKRARKYYLGVTTITQDVEDFVKNKYGKPIITNSSLQLLLKQAPAALEMLQKVFNLTEGEKYMLLNSGIGQGLFFAGLKHVAIQIIASYGEDKLVTTNPEEMLSAAAQAAEYAGEEEAPEGEAPAEEPVSAAEQTAEEPVSAAEQTAEEPASAEEQTAAKEDLSAQKPVFVAEEPVIETSAVPEVTDNEVDASKTVSAIEAPATQASVAETTGVDTPAAEEPPSDDNTPVVYE